LFASIIAPFGGFFASGFKRAFKIKVCNCFSNIEVSKSAILIKHKQTCHVFPILQDFGDSIPGHGGITDRMDCQVDYFDVSI